MRRPISKLQPLLRLSSSHLSHLNLRSPVSSCPRLVLSHPLSPYKTDSTPLHSRTQLHNTQSFCPISFSLPPPASPPHFLSPIAVVPRIYTLPIRQIRSYSTTSTTAMPSRLNSESSLSSLSSLSSTSDLTPNTTLDTTQAMAEPAPASTKSSNKEVVAAVTTTKKRARRAAAVKTEVKTEEADENEDSEIPSPPKKRVRKTKAKAAEKEIEETKAEVDAMGDQRPDFYYTT